MVLGAPGRRHLQLEAAAPMRITPEHLCKSGSSAGQPSRWERTLRMVRPERRTRAVFELDPHQASYLSFSWPRPRVITSILRTRKLVADGAARVQALARVAMGAFGDQRIVHGPRAQGFLHRREPALGVGGEETGQGRWSRSRTLARALSGPSRSQALGQGAKQSALA